MPNWRNELATRLIAARGIESQASLGARASVSDKTIGLIETRKLKAKPRSETVIRLAIATESNPAEWLVCAGMPVCASLIERYRKSINTKTTDQLRDELVAYVDAALCVLQRRVDILERIFLDK